TRSPRAADLTTAPDDSLICPICMEEPVIFGLLADCSHVLCINCIRNWHGQESSSEDVTLSLVTPERPLERYKARSLQQIPCRYFTTSNPDCRYCPFGRDRMYQHQNEDGTPYVFNKGADFHIPHPVSTCSLPDSYQDSRLLQPANGSAAIPDTASPHSPLRFLLPLCDACGPPGTARPHDDDHDDDPLPTLPDSSLRDIGESESVQSSLSEAPPLTEVGATASVPSSARELPGGATETRHQEPPFMTDGRGRVVWSCSAAKRGELSLAIRSL
ncbi:hypothetical protein EDB86DRAFT_2885217, partial [Lactarius hatsudake]